MSELGELPKISEVQRDLEDERLLKLTDEDEPQGWPIVMKEVTAEILLHPKWLIDPLIFRSGQIESNQRLLNLLKTLNLDSLDDLSHHYRDEPANFAFVMRFLETFSNKYNFPYVWRGGTLEDIEKKTRGTFTFRAEVAKTFVKTGFGGDIRRNPCLIGLPVKAILDHYKQNGRPTSLIAEHGYDGIFNISFDIYIPGATPDGTMIYLPS